LCGGRHGLEHICHHHANSLLIGWHLTMLALTIERLYRLRYLHRGTHRVPGSAQLLLHLWLSLALGRVAIGTRNPEFCLYVQRGRLLIPNLLRTRFRHQSIGSCGFFL
jgi:hypothetical protein